MGIKRNEKNGFAMCWNPKNSRGIILQGHSYMERRSLLADREDPEGLQTSRVRITVSPLCDSTEVNA